MSIGVRAVLVVLFLSLGVAQAAEVYVNGVKVTGALKDQAFQGVNVQFSSGGDIFINAPGRKVELKEGVATVVSTTPPADAKGPLKYWLVLKNQQVGHYMVLLKVNGAKVASVPSTSRQKVVDISTKVTSGSNEVEIVYLPMTDAPKIGVVDGVEVIVGQGYEASNGPLTLKRVLGTHKHKTGSQSAEAAVIPLKIP